MLSPRKHNPTSKNIFKQVRRHSLGMLGFFLLTIASFLIATDIDAATGINQQISFQGKVVNANGTNVANGSYTFVFSLYTVSSGGTNIWTESKSVTVTDGIFQTNLGDTTALPGSVDFNTDNIYLGINFNADGEMSPRVRFTAAPYAFNAKKVGGLTVTDTTGTLTIPNSETISFGGSFSTTASNDIALTTSGATTLTLPTTGTLATLAGSEVFTNKSIGSTGLTFSGATTDITTATNEDLTVVADGTGVIVLNDSVTSGALTISGATTDITTASGESLVIVANGAGVVDIQDATTVDSLTADTGGVSIAAGQSYTGAGAVTLSSAATTALTVDSGTTGALNLGTGNNAKTISLGTGTAGNTINIATDNTTSDTINIGSALDNVAITGDQWSITNAGVLTVVSCTGCAGGSSLTVRESDGSPSVASTGTLEFGPASTSSEEFIVTDQTGGVARVVAGTMIGKLNEAETVTAGWTFNTVATTFTTAINANGGLTTTTTDQNLNFSANGAGDFVFAVDSGTIVSLTGGADGTSALTIAAGDLTLTDGDLIVTAGDANFTLDAADTLNISKTGANAGDVANITASSVNAIDGLQIALSSTADAAGDAVSGLDIAWTESTDGDTWTAINLPNTTSTNSTTRGLVIGTGYDTGVSIASGGLSATGTIAFPTLSTNGFVKTTGGTGTLSVSTDVALTTDTSGNYVQSVGTSALTGLTGGAAGSEGAALTLALDYTQALSGDVGLAANAAVFGQSGLVFEGSAADTSETFIAVTNATADRTLTLQDNSGVIPLGTAGNTLFFTTSGATNVTLPTSGTLISQAYATVQDETSGLTQRSTINFTGAGVSCVDNSGSSRTDCTIAGGSATTWDAIGDPSGAGAIAFGSTAQTLDWGTMDANTSYFTFNFTNGGTSAGTDNGVVINNVLSNASPTDSITENLLLIQQLDSTGGNTILVSNALGIDAAGDSGITNAISITNSAGNITNGINIADTAGGTITDGILVSGTLTNILNTPSIDISGAGAITGATGVSTTTVTASSTIAANGGITFDASTDTVGAFTAAGTINMSTNILENIGNAGTDFIASTGALTLAGVLTANGGITLASSQTFTASSLSYMDLGAVTHGTTAVQGLRLPQAASASPSSPTSGEGYLAWDAGGNQVIYYNGSAWATFGAGGGYATIKDESTSLTQRTTLAFLGAGVSCADNVTQTECTISGGGSSDLAATYNAGSAGNQTITLDSGQDSIIVSNPSSAGTDSAFAFKVEQLNTGIDNDAVSIDNRGTGDGLRIDDESGDTTPFIVDQNGRVGIMTASVDTTTNAKLGLQVGSETQRGDINVFGDVKTEGYDIQRTLTGIIDVFVYDTSRDTDGGDWRNSRYILQNSWATETKDDGIGDPCDIATDDRCGSSTFPRKAILVTTASALYIFDASDNTMWMKFTQAGTFALGADTNNNPSGVGGENGVVVVGTNGASATGMYAFDFKQDVMYRYNATNRVQADVSIGSRNSTATYATDANTNLAILDAVVNDVSIAMQTSSNEGAAGTLIAPIDSQAGPVRGVTLIAAATDTGVSVVHMGPREVYSYSDATGNDYNQVVVTSRGRMYATNETLAQLEEWRNIDKDPASEVNGTPDRVYDETIGKSPITTGTVPTISTSPGALAVIERGSSARESAAAGQIDSGDIVFVGTNQGLAEVHTSGGLLVAASWSKLTTTTIATPYMNGAVRSVFLFDEAAGATSAVSAIGSGANVMDTAGGTSPTFGQGGVRGQSVNFNNNSYLCSDANIDGTCDNDTDYNLGTVSFTVSMWFKHGTTAALDTLFDKCWVPATPAATSCAWGGMTASGAIAFGIDDDATWTVGSSMDDMITSSALYNDNQWHHAIFTNTDTDICLYIDGRQAVACDSSLTATATLELGAAAVTIGGTCSGANCVTGTNLWDGSVDDFTWDSNAGTTAAGLTAQSANKMYLDGRAHLIRPSTTVTDATTFTSTTIGDSGESYTVGSYVGLVVELTGGTGSGQTRTIISNTATTFTVYPAFSVTPDATTDYRVSPAKIYGTSNNVTAIGVDSPTSLNKVRKVYVGTSDGSDGGAITTFTNAGAGSIKTEVIHSDAGYESDDLGSDWTGTDADDISAIGSYSDTLVFASGAFFRTQRRDISLKQLQTDMFGAFEDVRQQLVASGLFGATQDVLGLGQGADLAERYYSDVSLEAGEIVAIDSSKEAGVKRAVTRYQKDVLGVVATKPGIILGSDASNAYPVALVGRVPVRVTNENGPIYAGDRITASATPGYGMYANQAGRVVGEALADAGDWVVCSDSDPNLEHPKLCTTVMVFVNLSDYYGQPVELAMAARDAATEAAAFETAAGDEEVGLTSDGASVRLVTAAPTREEKLLAFLREIRDERAKSNAAPSEVFTDRVAASSEVVTPRLIADEIWAKSIKADSIEGLAIYTNRIASLEAKYAGLVPDAESAVGDVEATKEKTLLNLEQFQVGSIAVAFDANVLGKLSVTGALRVIDAAEFQGKTTFASLVSFLSDAVFRGKVAFETVPTFGTDTAGFATIEKGRKKVRVNFTEAYEKQPIVTVALTRDISPLLDEGADDDLRADVAAVEKDFAETLFEAGIQYLVTEKDQSGFTILLSKDAPTDLSFSWVAIAVQGAKTFESGKAEEVKTEESAETPSETPTMPVAEPPVTAPIEEVSPVTAPPVTTDPVDTVTSVPTTT